MPSLIGSAPNQVPTNGMLGTMAFQDSDNALVQNITATGNVVVPTKVVTDNSTSAATTAFVKESQKQKEAATATTGTSTAYILAPTFTPLEYYTGQTFVVQFHIASGTTPTINISGLGAKNLVRRNSGGTFSNLASGDIPSNATSKIRYNGTAFELIDVFPATSAQATAGTNTFNYLSPSGLRSGLNASGSAPIYACRAWVNFNGTGTVAIKSSGNVSSVTDLGVGKYQLNFTTSLEDVNYSWSGSASLTIASDSNRILVDRREDMTKTTSALAVRTMSGGTAADITDSADVSVQVFR